MKTPWRTLEDVAAAARQFLRAVLGAEALDADLQWEPATWQQRGRPLAVAPSNTQGSRWRGPMKPANETYVSTDVETDGPIPGPHSMLSFASAAYRSDKMLVSTFSANLETLPGASGHPNTMAWWKQNPVAWEACRSNPETPDTAMARYLVWVKSLPGRPVFVAYPAGFDFLFLYWYLMRFAGESPFSHWALDIKTYAMAMLKTGYRDATKRNMPKRWFDQLPHTHVALDDAIEQGALFCNMLRENASQEQG